jgi:ATPase subunit of ABC transporter with duplicated ATPase domains
MLGDSADLWERAAADGTLCARSSATTGRVRRYIRAGLHRKAMDRQERARLTKAIEDAERGTGMTTDAAIHVQGLEKSLQELRVLRGVDLRWRGAAFFALLGSNGAGKTTIVNILSTLLRPDAGMVTVDGFGVGAQAADVRSRSASPGSSRRWMRSSPGGRTWCWWPGCAT